MSIRISKIDVKNLGPIERFSQEFGIFNLIYSPNEFGKTFLTEFIIRTLFKNHDRWTLRAETAPQGKVTVEGIGDKSIDFFITSKKIESYLPNNLSGITPSFSKLLVVKGAESNIDNTKVGVERTFLKNILSGIGLLETIAKKVNPIVRKAVCENGLIIIDKMGEGKNRAEIKTEIEGYESFLKKVEDGISAASLMEFQEKRKILSEKLTKLELAKKHAAYKLSVDTNTYLA